MQQAPIYGGGGIGKKSKCALLGWLDHLTTKLKMTKKIYKTIRNMNEYEVKTPEQCKSASVKSPNNAKDRPGGGVYINVLSCTVRGSLT